MSDFISGPGLGHVGFSGKWREALIRALLAPPRGRDQNLEGVLMIGRLERGDYPAEIGFCFGDDTQLGVAEEIAQEPGGPVLRMGCTHQKPGEGDRKKWTVHWERLLVGNSICWGLVWKETGSCGGWAGRTEKVQQEIAGGFRTKQGAIEHCRIRSYLGTLRKNQINLFDGIVKALAGQPWRPTQAPSAAQKKTISAPHQGKSAA